jgi:hypothetical protein
MRASARGGNACGPDCWGCRQRIGGVHVGGPSPTSETRRHAAEATATIDRLVAKKGPVSQEVAAWRNAVVAMHKILHERTGPARCSYCFLLEDEV